VREAVGSNEVKKDYFKNEILTLIRAEMWKILISSTLKDEEEGIITCCAGVKGKGRNRV
jgi:hypothetical protein